MAGDNIRSICNSNHPCFIIVIENEKAIWEILKNIFPPSTGIELLFASTLGDGLKLFAENAGKVEAGLIDLGLSDSNGLETLRTIRVATQGRVALIPMTGSTDLEDDAFAIGAQDFFAKPLDQIDVVTRVKYAILRQRDKNAMRDYCILLENNINKIGLVEAQMKNTTESDTVKKLREVRQSLQGIIDQRMPKMFKNGNEDA
jgi:DNA-binding response OmpR family regulator